MKPRKPIRRISTKRRALMEVYRRERKFFLTSHPWCAWARLTQGVKVRSEQVHHLRGRAGKLLLDQRFWVAVSARGHEWIHKNIGQARKLGLLCPKGKWGQPEPVA